MADDLAAEEKEQRFAKHLRAHLFGLIACVDPPDDDELFPMASAVLIQVKDCYALLTAAHFLQDVKRWREKGRLARLLIVVHNQAQVWGSVEVDLKENRAAFSEDIDIGFILLRIAVVQEMAKYGGAPIRKDALKVPETLDKFYLVGHLSSRCKLQHETIASEDQGERVVHWTISKPSSLAVGYSELRFEGFGDDQGTLRFGLPNPFDSYRGMSGGPVFGYAEGARVGEYALVGIQSKQILEATREQKPTHVIVACAQIAVRLAEKYIDGIMGGGSPAS